MTDTLTNLRIASTQRQVLWNGDAKPSLSYRGNELAGETGETCNLLKKLDREQMGMTGSRASLDHLADELADIIICVDLIAGDLGIDLSVAVPRKFNATSRKVGFPVFMEENVCSPL